MSYVMEDPPQWADDGRVYLVTPGFCNLNVSTGVISVTTAVSGSTPSTAVFDWDDNQNVTLHAGRTLELTLRYKGTSGTFTGAYLEIATEHPAGAGFIVRATSDPFGSVAGTWTTATARWTVSTADTYYRLRLGLQIPRPAAVGDQMTIDAPPFAESRYLPVAVAPTITTTTLGALAVGTPATVTLAATGDTPITWTVDDGALPDGLSLNSSTGAVTGTPTTAGAYSVTAKATNATGNDTQEYTGTVTAEPDDPADELAELPGLVAAFLGRPDDAAVITLATVHVPIVVEYVRGYTRGRGFAGDVPALALRSVIVAACARLTANPRQVGQFQTGDYSERPAILAGWTVAELGVLRRYRRISA